MGIRSLRTASIANGVKRSKFWDQQHYLSDMDLIQTTTVTTSTPSVTFSNLNSVASQYRHLRLVVLARAMTNSSGQSLTLEFNDSSAADYNAHSFYAFASTNVVANTWIYANTTSANAFIGGAEGQTAYPNIWQPNIYEFPNFSATDKTKFALSLNGASITNSLSTGAGSVAWNNVMWNQTSAITSIKLSLVSNFSSGTRFSLYGLKG